MEIRVIQEPLERELQHRAASRNGSDDGAFVSGQSDMTFGASASRGDLTGSVKFRLVPAFLPHDPVAIQRPKVLRALQKSVHG